MDSLRSGSIDVVMLPARSRYTPAIPEGMESVEVGGRGAGTYIFRPSKISAATIAKEALHGRHGSLLGHIYTKDQIRDKYVVVLQAILPNGTPVQESVVLAGDPVGLEKQRAILQARHPKAVVAFVDPATTSRNRILSRENSLHIP